MPSAAKTASNLDGVLGVPIPDEEAKRTPPSQVEGEVPGLLRDPGGVGMPRRSGHVDPPCVDFQHEEHVQRAQPRSLHVKKSAARIPVAWLRKNSAHVGAPRRGAGPSPSRRRSVRIAVAETVIPSLASSPLIRRHPQRGFSRPIRRMRSRTSSAMGGLPPGDRRA
jgi:hypothetical protein